MTEEDAASARNGAPSVSGVIPSHLFVELTSLDELSFPTSSSARIKYTCLSASAHYLAVGSTSGTVYLFSRYAARYRKSLSSVPVQVIASKEGAAVKVLVATNEKHLAVATNRGHISIASLTGGAPTTVLNNTLHKGAIVTSLIWAEDGTKLLAGDSKGLVSCSRVASRNLFRTACEPVLEADSGVVQLDVNGDAVLISTATRSQLFHLGRSTCIQVGKKLRHEPCGAIFARPGAIERPLIFAGRPNGRLWECDCEGAVYSTHQFSNVTDVPLPPVATHRHDFDPDSGPSLEAIRFGRVHVIYLQEHMFILTVNDSRLCVVEPQKGRVVLVCDVGHSAREYAVCGSDVFLLCESNGSLRKLSLFPLDKAVDKLHWRECYRQAAQVMLAYGPSLPPPSPWKTETVVDVLNHVKDDDAFTSVMIDQLTALLHTAKRRDANAKTSTVMRLSTGVHRVVRIMENSGYDDDFTFRAPSPLRPKRSRSSPNIDEMLMASKGGDNGRNDEIVAESNAQKRLSLPASAIARLQNEEEEGETARGNADGIERGISGWNGGRDVRRADVFRSDSDRSLPSDRTRRRRPASRSEESLQTLLDAASEAREIRFDSETTLADAQHDLAGVDQLHLLPQLDLRYQTPTLFHEHELEDRLLRSLEQGGRKVLDRLSRLGRSDQGSKETSSSLEHSETVPPLAVRSPLKVMPEYPAVMRNAPKNRRRRVVNANSSSPSPSPLDGSRNSPTLSLTITRDSLTRDQHANDSLSSPSESLPSTVVTQADVHRSSSDDFMKPVVSRPNDMNKCVDVDDWQNASSPTDGKDSILESSGTPTELNLASRVSCLRCGLHRSWAFLLKLGKFVSSVPVSPDDYLEGGVPASVKQWAELFRTCVSLRSTRSDNTPLCSSCASLFEQQGEPNDALPLETRNIQTNLITPLVRSIDDAQLKRLFLFPSAKTPKSSKRLSSKVKEENGGTPMKEEPTKVLSQKSCNETPALISSSSQSTLAAVPHLPSEETNGISVAESTETAATTSSHSRIDSEQSTPTNDLLAYSTYVNPAYSSVGEESGHFGWAGSVRLADLCLAMSYVLGVDAVFDLVEADAALAKALDASDWASLAAFVRPPTSRIEFGPPELLDALFRDVADGRETSTRVRYSTTNGHPSPTRPGFVLSVIEECPCCTLPLNTRVSDVERKLTVFDCGHAYHTICLLQDKSLKQCIRCILQRP